MGFRNPLCRVFLPEKSGFGTVDGSLSAGESAVFNNEKIVFAVTLSIPDQTFKVAAECGLLYHGGNTDAGLAVIPAGAGGKFAVAVFLVGNKFRSQFLSVFKDGKIIGKTDCPGCMKQ